MSNAFQSVMFFEASCEDCQDKFAMPSLGDFSYGDFVLQGERGTVFGYLHALFNPAWEDIKQHLQNAGLLWYVSTRSQSDCFQQVVVSCADEIDGQRLSLGLVCPSCRSCSIKILNSKPLGMREIPCVTFGNFLSCSKSERLRRLEELWSQHQESGS